MSTAIEQGVWRTWRAPAEYAPSGGALPDGEAWPLEAAYADERDGRHLYVEVQYRCHAAFTHGERRYPTSRYWYMEGMAYRDNNRAVAQRIDASFLTYDAAMTAARDWLAQAEEEAWHD